QFLSQPQMSPAESYASDLGQTFVELGLDIDAHGPTILAKLDELGPQHWTVEAIQSPDPTTRANATRAVVDLSRAGQTTVSRARQDDVVQARVQEETLREAASGVNSGGPRIEKPK